MVGTYAIFLDFTCLHQKSASGERTPAELSLFNRSLSNMLDWYSHPSLFTLKLTKLPPGYPVDKVDPARRTFNGMVHIMVIIAIALHLFEAYVTGATDRRTRLSVIYPWRWPRRK